MILSGNEIRRRLGNAITIDPFNEANLNPNSYNLTLHNELMTYEEVVLDMAMTSPWVWRISERWCVAPLTSVKVKSGIIRPTPRSPGLSSSGPAVRVMGALTAPLIAMSRVSNDVSFRTGYFADFFLPLPALVGAGSTPMSGKWGSGTRAAAILASSSFTTSGNLSARSMASFGSASRS